MNTEEAIKILLAELYEADRDRRPSLDSVRRAHAHIVATPEAWRAFAELYEMVKGQEPPNSQAMERLFGCGRFIDQLERFAGVTGDELARTNPALAAHLAHCRGCAELFASGAAFIAGMTGDLAAASAVAPAPVLSQGLRWEQVEGAGGRLYRLVEAVVYDVRERVARFTAFPAGMVPHLAPASRSADEAAAGGDPSVERLSFALPAGGGEISVRLSASGGAESVTLQIEFGAPLRERCSIELLEAETGAFVSGEVSCGSSTTVFGGMPRARYRVRFVFLESGNCAEFRLDCPE